MHDIDTTHWLFFQACFNGFTTLDKYEDDTISLSITFTGLYLKTPFMDIIKSWKMTLKCEPSQYGGPLVCLQAQSMTVRSLSGVKRRGEMLGAFDL